MASTPKTEIDDSAWLQDLRYQRAIIEPLKQLAALDESTAVALFADLSQKQRPPASVFAAVGAQTGLTKEQEVVDFAIGIFAFFGTLPPGVLPNQAIDLLVQSGVSNDLLGALQQRIAAIQKNTNVQATSAEMKRDEEANRSAGPAVPRLQEFWTRCIEVGTFDPEYDASVDPKEYAPRLASTICLVVLQIDVNSYGNSQEFAVGLTGKELGQLIRRLQLAEKQLTVMRDARKTEG